jgi:hypothetical protein
MCSNLEDLRRSIDAVMESAITIWDGPTFEQGRGGDWELRALESTSSRHAGRKMNPRQLLARLLCARVPIKHAVCST